MDAVVCNYCGADDPELVNHGPDLLLDRPGDFQLVRCRRCGLIYQNPRLSPDELSAHYPPDYQPYKTDPAQANRRQRISEEHQLARRGNLLQRHASGRGRLLVVGCSTGLFLKTMRARGWQAVGVEPSAYASAYAREQFGLDVQTGTLESAEFPSASFDVVSLWDVLEHVTDPRATLTEIARILRPGGLLALSLPNPACPEARWFGAAWVGWDRPRHLHLFTPSVLRRYLTAAGFDPPVTESLGGRLGLTLMSVEFACRARGIPATRWRPLLGWLYAWPLRLLTWPFYRLAERLNRTTSMNVFAVRRWEPTAV